MSAYTRFCAALSKLSLVLAVIGLIAVILCVQWQVFGRYVMNDTPTWAEALALVLYTRYIHYFQIAGMVLLVAMIGAIVGDYFGGAPGSTWSLPSRSRTPARRTSARMRSPSRMSLSK